MSDKTFWDAVGDEADASLSATSNFGQITITPNRYIHWVDSQPIDVDAAAFNAIPQNEKSLEISLAVKISEFKPDLEWEYERRVRIGDKDWRKTLVPSVAAIMGKDSMKKGAFQETLQKLDGMYVEAQDVPQQGSDEYSTIKLVQVFDNRDDCYAAWVARFNVSGANASVPPTAPLLTPASYDTASWQAMVPAIKQALAGGATVPEVATQYAVEVPFIAAIAALP